MDPDNPPTIPSERNKKRRAQDTLHLSDDDADMTYPRFLVITARDETPIKCSIFAIHKFIQCGVGDVKDAKKLRSGAILLEVTSKKQAEKALSMTTWFDTEIKVTPHRSLNTCRGVI